MRCEDACIDACGNEHFSHPPSNCCAGRCVYWPTVGQQQSRLFPTNKQCTLQVCFQHSYNAQPTIGCICTKGNFLHMPAYFSLLDFLSNSERNFGRVIFRTSKYCTVCCLCSNKSKINIVSLSVSSFVEIRATGDSDLK